MKKTPAIVIASLLLWIPVTTSVAEEPFDQAEIAKSLSADTILGLVRKSQVGNFDLQGKLRKGKVNEPLGLMVRPNQMIFKFAGGREALALVHQDKSASLRRITGNKSRALTTAEAGKAIGGTDVTYGDLSLHFLYWPRPVRQADASVRLRKCWVLRLHNPKKSGPYRVVQVWVDQKSGGMMKAMGYDFNGRPLKEFAVKNVQKIGDAWFLQKMQITSYNPTTLKKVGAPTYLELRKPK